jgi:hypothetical protein
MLKLVCYNSLRTDGNFRHQGPEKFKIVESYYDHSLESSWGALSDGNIRFSIQPFSGENAFSQKNHNP